MTSRRGSVIIESAMMLTMILFILYGSLQMGILGLEQLTVDGGAFAMAHQQSFQGGATTYYNAKTFAQETLPHLVSPNVVIPAAQAGEPPAAQFAGQYGFNTPNARYGGVSMVQPVQIVATVTRNNIPNIVFGLVGATLSVTGTAIEPAYRLINPHGNVSGSNFNTALAFNTASDPLSESAPPYFVAFTYIQTCPYQLAGNSALGWTTCPNPNPSLAAIGSAEYLDAHNWSRPVNGVMPSGVGPGQGAVFWETRYHQTLFANISASLASANPADPLAKQKILDPLGTDPSTPKDVACVYLFDNINTGSYPPGSVGITDPLFALHPDATSLIPKCVAP